MYGTVGIISSVTEVVNNLCAILIIMLQCLFTNRTYGIVVTIIYSTCKIVENHVIWLLHMMVNLSESLELTHSMLMFNVF